MELKAYRNERAPTSALVAAGLLYALTTDGLQLRAAHEGEILESGLRELGGVGTERGFKLPSRIQDRFTFDTTLGFE